ncbi:MAG: hypothetical protein E3J90_12285, partial [Promethearchaeota archaeon]
MTIESVLKDLLGKNFSKVTIFCLDFIKKSNQDEDSIRKTFESLHKLGIKTDKIAANSCLLRWNVKIIEDRFEKLVSLGVNPKKIAQKVQLLGMNPKAVKDHYDKLVSLGFSSQKITQNAAILANKPKTIQDNYNKLFAQERGYSLLSEDYTSID